MTTNAARALDPLEFRFTEPEDVAKYGDGWYVYDESPWLRMRARDLIDLEAAMGLTVVTVMNGVRSHTTLGDTAAAWMSIRAMDPTLAGEFDDFNPVTNLIEWRPYEGKAPAAQEAAPAKTAMPDELDEPLPTPEPQAYTPWGNPDSVVLPTLPTAG